MNMLLIEVYDSQKMSVLKWLNKIPADFILGSFWFAKFGYHLSNETWF